MKKQKTQSKIIVALTAVVILLVAVSATLTFAYFTATKTSNSNDMTFGTLGLNVNQLLDAEASCTHTNGSSTIENLIPGCEIAIGSNNNIVVTGNIDALVRAKLTVTVWQTYGITAADCGNFTGAAAETQVSANGDKRVMTNWAAYDADNTVTPVYQYYKKSTAVAAGDGTDDTFAEEIFSLINAEIQGWIYNSGDNYYYLNSIANNASFTFAGTIELSVENFGNAWQGAKMQLNLVVDAIQAEHLVDGTTLIKVVKANEGNAISDVQTKAVNGVYTSVKTGTNDAGLMAAAIASADAWTVDLDTGLVTP